MRIISRFASRLAWLTATPLGSEVEPDVYCKKGLSCVMQLAKRDDGFFRAAIAEENIGSIVRLRYRTPCQQRHKRGKRLHLWCCQSAVSLSDGARCMLFGKITGQFIDSRIVVKIVRRELQPEFFLKFHHDVDNHRRV